MKKLEVAEQMFRNIDELIEGFCRSFLKSDRTDFNRLLSYSENVDQLLNLIKRRNILGTNNIILNPKDTQQTTLAFVEAVEYELIIAYVKSLVHKKKLDIKIADLFFEGIGYRLHPLNKPNTVSSKFYLFYKDKEFSEVEPNDRKALKELIDNICDTFNMPNNLNEKERNAEMTLEFSYQIRILMFKNYQANLLHILDFLEISTLKHFYEYLELTKKIEPKEHIWLFFDYANRAFFKGLTTKATIGDIIELNLLDNILSRTYIFDDDNVPFAVSNYLLQSGQYKFKKHTEDQENKKYQHYIEVPKNPDYKKLTKVESELVEKILLESIEITGITVKIIG